MAAFLKGLFGQRTTPPASAVSDDADFPEFDRAPDPSPASISPVIGIPVSAQPAQPTSASAITYTKWYRVWERTSPRDFYQEATILPFIILLVGIHVWGRRKNRRKAKAWLAAHGSALDQEYAVVGFTGRKSPTVEDVQSSGLAKAGISAGQSMPGDVLKEKTAQEFETYATGRQNIAFLDIKISLFKSFFFESSAPPTERMEATAYAFDGKEKDLIPRRSQESEETFESRFKGIQSAYDGFVWAVVHKECMRRLREDRYDLSLTVPKDHSKLPSWAIVMSESGEITDSFLSADLVKAIEAVGDTFEFLIVTDQPIDKPQKINDTTPRKRISLSLKLSPSDSYAKSLPLFSYFLRLPDILVAHAHFRPEIQRKLRATRDEEVRKLKKVDEGEKAEERRLEGEKKKKEMRDTRLKGMSAEEQRKFLEREREKGMKRQEKKMTRKA